MNSKEAYKRLVDHLGHDVHVIGCREYDNFYGFYFVKNKSEDRVFVGGSMTLVNKKTGKVISEDDLPKPISPSVWWKDVDISELRKT